jgi:Flp pilus assembly protein TadD
MSSQVLTSPARDVSLDALRARDYAFCKLAKASATCMYPSNQLLLRRIWILILLNLVGLSLGAHPTWSQGDGGSGLELRGNAAEISVNIKDSSGQAIYAPVTVKLYRQGTPFDQVSTSKGRAFFIVHALGEFRVTVEAAGYRSAEKDISLPVAVTQVVDVTLQRDVPSNVSPGPAGESLLAPKAREALDRGLQAIRDDKLDDAERALDQAMKLAPSNPEVLYAQGVLYLKRSDWPKAQAVLEKATQVDPNGARSFAALGMALCNEKKYQEAVAPLEKALELDPNNGWETHWSLAKSYYHLERYDDALKIAQLAQTEANGQAPQVDLLVAQALTAVGRFEDAALVLRQMLKQHPDVPEAATAKRFLERLKSDGKIK